MEDELKVLPSDDSAQETWHEESPVYFCGKNETTDRICELRRILNQATALGISTGSLSSICELLESADKDSYTDEFQATVTNISMQVHELLERCLESASAIHVASQLSPNDFFEEYDSGTVTESDLDRFGWKATGSIPMIGQNPGLGTSLRRLPRDLARYSDNVRPGNRKILGHTILQQADRVLDRDLDCCEYWLPPGTQDVERDDPSGNLSVATDPLDDQEPVSNALPLDNVIMQSQDLTLSSFSFCEDLEVVTECDRTIFELSNPSDAELTELASAFAPDIEFGANSPTLPLRESTDLSAPENDPPSYQPSASISSLQSTQAEIKAEYLQFIVVWIMLGWRIVSQGFWLLKTALRVIVLEGFASKIANSVVIDSSDFTGNSREFADDSIDSFAEPVPPDKSFHSDPLIHSKNSSDSELMNAGSQDTNDLFPTSPHIQFIELDYSPKNTDSDSVHSHEHDFQHDLRKSFISFEPSTEYPSNHEPFQ
ncbi:hypothetical protein K438DRAFT_1788205 [Mycena galopus ATCC 62051]|nr:hypothetical protein K438DRAFT_1788205 [Mycena galopus ATCC 62051]